MRPTVKLLVYLALLASGPVKQGDAQIKLGTPDFTIRSGRLAGSMRIGRVASAVIDAQGNLYVLDDELNQLTVFDRHGRPTSAVSGDSIVSADADGPARFTSLSPAAEGGVALLDQRSGTMWVYAVRGPNETLVRTKAVANVPRGTSMCAMHGRYYFAGRGDTELLERPPLIYSVDRNGGDIRAFGTPFGNYGPLAASLVNQGRLLCMPQARMLVVASDLYPEMRGYSEVGQLLWASTLSDVRLTPVIEESTRVVKYGGKPNEPFDVIVSLVPIGTRTIAIQVGRKATHRRPSDSLRVDTQYFDLQGRPLSTQPGLPAILSAGEGRLLMETEHSRQLWAVRPYAIIGAPK
jgi:hypothetical protein